MTEQPDAPGPNRRAILPAVLIAAVIIVPVGIWAAGSGDEPDGLRVEQSESPTTGAPEIVVGVPREYNNMAESGNRANVVLVCFDAAGNEVLESNRDWPFLEEAGYDRPHTHQPVTDEQLKALANCTVRGLKHELTGALRRS